MSSVPLLMVLMGRLPLAFAIAEPEADVGIAERCWESGGERMEDEVWFAGVWVRAALSRSEEEGEEIIWLSPSLSADMLAGRKVIGGLEPGDRKG